MTNSWHNVDRPEWAGFAALGGDVALRLREVGRRIADHMRVVINSDEPVGRRLKFAFGAAGGLTALIIAAVFLYAVLLIPFTPGISTLRKSKVERPSVVLSADGEEITRFRRVNREWVGLENVSEHVVNALIATEDHRFYQHPGVDPIRMLGAFAATLSGRRQGGSTITQQLARNMFPEEIGRSVSMTRKLKEMITAFKLEITFSKEEILEAYLNTVPFYFGAYGIEMAARTYFSTSASELGVVESATLVGMLKGTYLYNPVRNPERALRRRNVALRQMVKRGFLQESDYEARSDAPIRLDFQRQEREPSKAPHFTEHLRIWLADWADARGYNIYRDSLVIHTTLSAELQQMASRAVQRQGNALQAVADVEWSGSADRLVARHPSTYVRYRHGTRAFAHFWSSRPDLVASFVRRTTAYRKAVASGRPEEVVLDSLMAEPFFMDSLRTTKTRLETGLVALDPKTSHVKAWVGSRDFKTDQYDHVARARRQPGSTFKPFVYARALLEGYSPEDLIEDREVEIPMEGDYVWRPRNAGETVSGREMSLRDGLVFSKNTITAQLVDDVGARDVARLARRMGVNRSELRAVPSIALGTSEVSLLEMVAAYGTFANLGVYTEPVLVTHIFDRHGELVEHFVPWSRRALAEQTARSVIDMMRGVIDQGTGQRVRTTFGIQADVAGKTGTTQFGADGWFILMHPNLVAGSWVGFNDPRVTFRSDYWGQGGNNALFVVGDFVRQALRSGTLEDPDENFPPPPDLDERPSFLTRAVGWVRDLFVSAWKALFGNGDEENPRQGDTYIADRSDAIQIDSEPDDEAMADSLTRMERRSNRLDSLIQRLSGDGDAPAADTASTIDPPEDAVDEADDPDNLPDDLPESDAPDETDQAGVGESS